MSIVKKPESSLFKFLFRDKLNYTSKTITGDSQKRNFIFRNKDPFDGLIDQFSNISADHYRSNKRSK